MSYILGASHLLNLVYAGSLAKAPFSLVDLEKLAGTTFSKQLQVTKDVVFENQDLYFEIQTNNEETKSLIEDVRASLDTIAKAIDTSNREEFKKYMTSAFEYFSREGTIV